MTNARADEGGAKVEPIYGVSDEAADLLGEITSDVEDLAEGGALDTCDVTIIGFGYDPGGEEKDDPREAGRKFTTQPQLEMHLRVDDIDGLDATRQFFPTPATYAGPDGKPRFRPVNENSKLGIFLAAMAGFGIADNDAQADNYHFHGWRDMIGIRYRRHLTPYEGFRKGQTTNVHVPICIYGVDNDVRARAGLPAIEVRAVGLENLQAIADSSEEPEAVAADAVGEEEEA